jgi:hypothetical protein
MANLQEMVKSSIDELYQIAEQVRNDAESSQEAKAAGKVFDKGCTLIGDNLADYLELDGISDNDLQTTQDVLGKLADNLGPKNASLIWKDDDVQVKLTALTGMSAAGLLSTEQKTIVDGITETLSKAKGTRAKAGDSPVIKGRPEKVVVTMLIEEDDEGNILETPFIKAVSTLTGDKKQSADNLGTSVLRLFFGKDMTEEQRKSDEAKAIRETARKVIESGQSATIGNCTLTPSAPRAEEETEAA